MDTLTLEDARVAIARLQLPGFTTPAPAQADDGRCYYIRKGQALTCAERGLGWDAMCNWCKYGPSSDAGSLAREPRRVLHREQARRG